MNWDNSILFEDFGPLHFPALIRFDLQVGGVPSQIVFFTFGPKKYMFLLLWAPS